MIRVLIILCLVCPAFAQVGLRSPAFVAQLQQTAASGSATAWTTANNTFGAARNNLTIDGVGLKFTAAQNFTITQLGRWVIAGNSSTHTLRLIDSGNNVLASVVVDCNGAATGAYLYGTLASSVSITSGQSYYVMTSETSSGDQFYDDNGTGISVTAVASHVESAFYSGGTVTDRGAGVVTYGPVDFKYTDP